MRPSDTLRTRQSLKKNVISLSTTWYQLKIMQRPL